MKSCSPSTAVRSVYKEVKRPRVYQSNLRTKQSNVLLDTNSHSLPYLSFIYSRHDMAPLKTFALLLTASFASFASTAAITRRDGKDDPYPMCFRDPNDSSICRIGILEGKYLYPALNYSNQFDAGDNVLRERLPSHPYQLSQWTDGTMPERCHWWAKNDTFDPGQFTIYNVTYPDQCDSPWVVCLHTRSSKTIEEIADVGGIFRIPVLSRRKICMTSAHGANRSCLLRWSARFLLECASRHRK